MPERGEYAIDPTGFARTLREQRRTRMKGGLYHLNQVLMAYNSNRIEGSRLDEEQTRYIYETRTIAGDALPVDDIVETVNSFELFDAVLDRFDEPITTAVMKDYHRILKRGTADARRPSFAVGGWKRVPNVVGGRETVAPGRVGPAIEDLLARTPGSMTLDDVADFHHRFESIHPFSGRQRPGRPDADVPAAPAQWPHALHRPRRHEALLPPGSQRVRAPARVPARDAPLAAGRLLHPLRSVRRGA